MVTTDILSRYYGGVLAFTKDTPVQAPEGACRLYRRGDEIHITPAMLHMIGSGIIPVENYKVVLRKVSQLEGQELLELAEIAAPRKMYAPYIRKVQGEYITKKDEYSVKVLISDTVSLVLTDDCNLAICEVLRTPQGINDIITPMTIHNQIECFEWLLKKHIDVFQLIKKGKAACRSKWNEKGYESPASPRFTKRGK